MGEGNIFSLCVSSHLTGGTPILPNGGGVPHPSWWEVPPCQVWEGGTHHPDLGRGYPHGPGKGLPPLDLGRGYPPPGPGKGYPCPDLGRRYPPPGPGKEVPPPLPGSGRGVSLSWPGTRTAGYPQPQQHSVYLLHGYKGFFTAHVHSTLRIYCFHRCVSGNMGVPPTLVSGPFPASGPISFLWGTPSPVTGPVQNPVPGPTQGEPRLGASCGCTPWSDWCISLPGPGYPHQDWGTPRTWVSSLTQTRVPFPSQDWGATPTPLTRTDCGAAVCLLWFLTRGLSCAY